MLKIEKVEFAKTGLTMSKEGPRLPEVEKLGFEVSSTIKVINPEDRWLRMS